MYSTVGPDQTTIDSRRLTAERGGELKPENRLMDGFTGGHGLQWDLLVIMAFTLRTCFKMQRFLQPRVTAVIC